MKKQKIWYRADNPVKNKVYVWRSIERVVRQGTGYEYVYFRGYKWVVVYREGGYELGYQIGR